MASFMTTTEIRAKSRSLASKAGLSIPMTLPLLEEELQVRKLEDVIYRLLCLHAVAATSYGFANAKATAWLRHENLEAKLTDAESRFVAHGEGLPRTFRTQIEGMWALAWAVNVVPMLDFWENCANDFVKQLPDIKISQPGAEWRKQLNIELRPRDSLVSACDLAYCLHWAIRQHEIEGKKLPARLTDYVVIERRRALEWLLCNEFWDAISLDT